MNELTTMSNNGGGIRSFWSRPEGRVGALVSALLGVGLLYGFYRILPALVKFATDLLHLTIVGAAIAAIVFVLMNEKFQLLVSYLFKSVMWHLTNAFVDLDPVGIIRGYLDTLGKYIKDMSEQMAILNGHIQRLTEKMNKYAKEREKLISNVKAAAQDMNKFKSAAIVNGKQAERLEEAYGELGTLRTKLQNAYEVLTRVRELAQVKFEDMNNAVNIEIDKREAYKAVGGVLKSAMKILKGGEGKELYDMSMDKLVRDYSLEMGRLENFLQETKGMFTNFDLEDEASAQRTIALIESWEKESAGKTLFIEQKPQPVTMAYSSGKSATDSLLDDILAKKLK